MGPPAHVPPASGGRMTSIDAVRGLVMVLVALDHCRDFFHAGNLIHSLTNLDSTTAAVFLTRWVTNFCGRPAPRTSTRRATGTTWSGSMRSSAWCCCCSGRRASGTPG
jgi:hypothetical protein